MDNEIVITNKDLFKDRINIIANLCKDDKNISKFNTFIDKINESILSEPYFKNIISKIVLEKINIIPPNVIKIKLIKNKLLSKDEINELSNILADYGFTNELSRYDFQFNNKIHRNIITLLISLFINNITKAYDILQRNTSEYDNFNDIMKNLEEDILQQLDITRI